MYIVEKHNVKSAEWLETRNMRGIIDDVERIVENNEIYKKVMYEKDIGRPGHYWGRDVVIEGAMPMAMFIAASQEFGADPDWWQDDRKFQDYMKRHPEFNWLKS